MQNLPSKSKQTIFGGLVVAGVLIVCAALFFALKQETTPPASQSEINQPQPQNVTRNNESSENKVPETNDAKKPSVTKSARVEDYPDSLRPLVEKIFALRAQKAQAEKEAAILEGKKMKLLVVYTEEYHRVKDLSSKLSKAKMRVAEVEEKLRPLEAELIDRMQLEKPQERNLV